jgi:hypothetical protein
VATGREVTWVGVDRALSSLVIDRRTSGAGPRPPAAPASPSAIVKTDAGFFGQRLLPWAGARDDRVALRFVFDACSVEVFGGDGAAVISELVFPAAESTGLVLRCEAPCRIERLRVWPLERPESARATAVAPPAAG